MTYPPEWPAPGKMHFRLLHERLGALNLDCDSGYVVTQYNLGFPEVREVKLPNSLDDGTFDVTRFFGARAVSLDVALKPHVGLSPASSRINSEAVLRDKLLGYVYPGIRSRLLFSEHGDRRVRQILIRGASAGIAVSQPDYNRVNVSWLAPRGTLYSYDERCYSYVFSETSGDVMELIIVNEGTVPVDWRASISGYSIHPRFILNGREILRLEYEAGPGDVITLDSFSRTITINGVPASYAYIEDDSTWFKVPPGMSSLVVSHQGGVTAAGYPYARWQVPISAPITDLFERADGSLGADWDEPDDLPADTVAVPLEIDVGAVIVTEPDGGTVPHEWGFARNVTPLIGGVGMYSEVDVTNLAQSSAYGPIARSRAQVYTNMRDSDAACQVLSVDFDYGIIPTPVAPLVVQDPFEDLVNWTVVGGGLSLVPGRNGTAMQITGSSTTATLTIPTESVSNTVVVGVAVKLTGAVSRGLFEFRSDGGVTLHGRVAVDGLGSIYVTDAAGVARVQSPAGAIVAGTWYYVEVRSVLSDIGLLELWVDGAAVGSVFDVDTNATFATGYDTIRFPSGTSGGSVQYDDFYLAVDTDAPLGPQDVPNGSLGWELHQYDAAGVGGNTVASGTVPYTFGAAATRLRLESGTDGEQRFLLNTLPVAVAVEESPVVGTLTGFGLSYETFDYESPDASAFTDDFERAALGADWVLPVPRSAGRSAVLPTISTGAAVVTSHTANMPQQVYAATSSGTTLVGGIAQTMPSYTSAGYMLIARVAQDNANGVPITASTGWTSLGQVTVGNAPGEFTEAFDNIAAWTGAGTPTIVGTGRTGNAVSLDSSSDSVSYLLPAANESDTIILGTAWRCASLQNTTFLSLRSDAAATTHLTLMVQTTGALQVRLGTGTGTILGTSATGLVTANTWYFVEIRAVLHDTAGAVTVRLNGTDVITLTGIDTKNAGTKTVFDSVFLQGQTTPAYLFDDLYVLTGGGAAFKGDTPVPVSTGSGEILRMAVFGRVCDGTSLDALTVTGGATEWATQIESYWNQTAGFPTNALSLLKVASASGITGFADSPSVDLGGTKDWMFLTSAGLDSQGSTSTSGPSGYSNLTTATSPGQRCAVRGATRTSTQGGTENPAALTGSTTNRPWIAFTIAIPSSSDIRWAGAEHPGHEYSAAETIAVEAEVHVTTSTGAPTAELYTHMVSGSPTCRALQADLVGKTWKMGHFVAGTSDLVAVASGAFPATFGAEQRIAIPGTPDGDYAGEAGVMVRFTRPGQVTKIRYYRLATTPTTVNLNVWSASTRIAGPFADTQGAGTAGYQTFTLPTPIAVTANQSVVFSGGQLPLLGFTIPSTPPTTDCTMTNGSVYNDTPGVYPNLSGNSGVFVEPTYEPSSLVSPYTLRFEGDADGTERFILNGVLVQSIDDPGAPTPIVPTRVGFGEHWTTAASSGPQVRSFAAFGTPFVPPVGNPDPTSPRIERFAAAVLSGANWAIPDRVVPATDPTNPRAGAARLEENYWVQIGVDDPTSPNDAALTAYRGAGSGMFVYADGWTFDGYGWRDNVGRVAYSDGAVVTSTTPATSPPNNPPPGGRPPWAWTPPVDPITGEPSILTVHFCFYDQWL